MVEKVALINGTQPTASGNVTTAPAPAHEGMWIRWNASPGIASCILEERGETPGDKKPLRKSGGWNRSQQMSSVLSVDPPPACSPSHTSDSSKREHSGSPRRWRTLDSSELYAAFQDNRPPEPYRPLRASIRHKRQSEQVPRMCRIPRKANADRLFIGTAHGMNNNSASTRDLMRDPTPPRGLMLPKGKSHRPATGPRITKRADHALNNRSDGFYSIIDRTFGKTDKYSRKGCVNRWASTLYSANTSMRCTYTSMRCHTSSN